MKITYKSKCNGLISLASVVLLLCSATVVASHHADDEHGHGHDNMHNQGHIMQSEEMGQHMREVKGHGRINKVMADDYMVNITHEPMPEMNWPKMSMNFRTQIQVDLNNLKPGQQVDFKLLVDEDHNYIIKEIIVK